MPNLKEIIKKTPILTYLLKRVISLRNFLRNIRTTPAKIEHILTEIDRNASSIEHIATEVDTKASSEAINQLSEKITNQLDSKASNHDVNYIRRQLLSIQTKFDRGFPETSLASGGETLDAQLPEGFYLAFENRFRGDFAAIQARQSVYLAIIQSAQAGGSPSPILDIGSGRGEWLQLLQRNALIAYGVDSDTSMVEACRELNLEVHLGDAFEHLTALPASSLGAITGFHIAEHLPFAVLVNLCAQALRALRPGGVLILETPNPENLLVGACYFYTDPTHQRPLPPDLLAFVAEYCGFAQVEIMRLHPFPQYDVSLADSDRPERFIFGPQDYALIARKASDAH